MNASKKTILLSGILDLIFALGLIALTVLYFFNPIVQLVLFIPFIFLIDKVIPLTSDLLNLLSYILPGIMGLFALLSLIFGSVTIAKSRKLSKDFYRSGAGLITFIIFEILALAFFTALLSIGTHYISIIIVSVLSLVVFLRFLGIILFYRSKKKFVAETPVSK